MESSQDITGKLVDAIEAVYPPYKAELERLKREAAKHWNEPHFIWEGLLRSASTLGNARGIRLMLHPKLHEPVRYAALSLLPKAQRLLQLKTSLRRAKVRMPDRKAGWLVQNFEWVEQHGGPEEVKKHLDALPGRDAKIEFLEANFEGIGPRYARNAMMDAHHSDFRDSIAIDLRIQKILSALNLPFTGKLCSATSTRGFARQASVQKFVQAKTSEVWATRLSGPICNKCVVSAVGIEPTT